MAGDKSDLVGHGDQCYCRGGHATRDLPSDLFVLLLAVLAPFLASSMVDPTFIYFSRQK